MKKVAAVNTVKKAAATPIVLPEAALPYTIGVELLQVWQIVEPLVGTATVGATGVAVIVAQGVVRVTVGSWQTPQVTVVTVKPCGM